MKVGESCVIRPQYRYSFRIAARKLGHRSMEESFRTPAGEHRITLTLLPPAHWRTGHVTQRMPNRIVHTGQFIKDSA